MFSEFELLSVPSPEDDQSERTQRAILDMVRDYEPFLMEIANEYNISSQSDTNTTIQVIGICYRASAFSLTMGSEMDPEALKNINQYRIQMEGVGKNVTLGRKIQLMTLTSQIGIDYRYRYLSESD